jgi:hypothetical protein
MKIVESMNTRAPDGTSSSVKEPFLVSQQASDFAPVQLQRPPGRGDDTRFGPTTAGIVEIALEGLSEDRAHLLPLPYGFELRAAEQVLIENGTDLAACHIMTLA